MNNNTNSIHKLVAVQLGSIETEWKIRLDNMGLKITPIMAETLVALYRRDGQQASTLARTIGRAPSSFTPVLDQLVRLRLVGRTDCAGDRRIVKVVLLSESERHREALLAAASEIEVQFRQLRKLLAQAVPA